VRFEGSRCVLAMESPLALETVRIGRHRFPLAADFTAPLAMMFVEMHPEKLGLARLLHPAKFASTTRIARLEPFDPNKTVVLVVHGLMSTPATWFPLINHLRAHEDMRRKYQFWFFSYPTGYPYSYSAAILRRELDHAEKRLPSHKKMVVIGHSMGGCVSRLLITDTQRRLWDQMFTVSPESMDVTPEHKHILTESAIFSHRPEIGRVIFISSPLRGSDLASNWLGRLGARLVQMPAALLGVGTDAAGYRKHAAGHLHLKRFPNSVDTLSPNNDFVLALNTVPIVKGIPYHTICGDRGRGDAPNSSDGLVPYWSSHLPGALSEKVVPSHHSAHQNQQAIEEVHRILTLHSK
jgi:pimeloyl-ACP methyl ester carboxylesterase